MNGRLIDPNGDPTAPPFLFTAIKEQLGRKLQPAKAPADVFVIDHAEHPSEMESPANSCAIKRLPPLEEGSRMMSRP